MNRNNRINHSDSAQNAGNQSSEICAFDFEHLLYHAVNCHRNKKKHAERVKSTMGQAGCHYSEKVPREDSRTPST